jgi:hypothetical protein
VLAAVVQAAGLVAFEQEVPHFYGFFSRLVDHFSSSSYGHPVFARVPPPTLFPPPTHHHPPLPKMIIRRYCQFAQFCVRVRRLLVVVLVGLKH